MEIYYCEKCSKRIAQDDIDHGRAAVVGDGIAYCEDCRSHAPAPAPAAARPTAPARPARPESRLIAAPMRPTTQATPAPPGKGAWLPSALAATAAIIILAVAAAVIFGGRTPQSTRPAPRPPVTPPVVKSEGEGAETASPGAPAAPASSPEVTTAPAPVEPPPAGNPGPPRPAPSVAAEVPARASPAPAEGPGETLGPAATGPLPAAPAGGGPSPAAGAAAATPGSSSVTGPAAPATPGETRAPSAPGGTLLADFGPTEGENRFGLDGWAAPIKDDFTKYSPLGPGGTVGSDTPSFNSQGVKGSEREFRTGETVLVTWYNARKEPVTITPKISFEDPDRRAGGERGAWLDMTAVEVPPVGSRSTRFVFTDKTAGRYRLVNVNADVAKGRDVVCDRVELFAPGQAPPLDILLVDFGSKPAENRFGLDGWNTVFKDIYTVYVAAGEVSGTAADGAGGYNYQGVKGPEMTLGPGDRAVVTWHNASDGEVKFTPKLSFDDAARPYKEKGQTGGTWYSMTQTTLAPRSSGTSEYVVTKESAGNRSLVNVSVVKDNRKVILCDRIELKRK